MSELEVPEFGEAVALDPVGKALVHLHEGVTLGSEEEREVTLDAIEDMLDTLAVLDDEGEVMRMNYERDMAEILAPVRGEVASLKAAYERQSGDLQEQIESLEGSVQELLLKVGCTVRGDRYTGVWAQGSVSWDTKRLEGYAEAHPEVLKFRKPGKPKAYVKRK